MADLTEEYKGFTLNKSRLPGSTKGIRENENFKKLIDADEKILKIIENSGGGVNGDWSANRNSRTLLMTFNGIHPAMNSDDENQIRTDFEKIRIGLSMDYFRRHTEQLYAVYSGQDIIRDHTKGEQIAKFIVGVKLTGGQFNTSFLEHGRDSMQVSVVISNYNPETGIIGGTSTGQITLRRSFNDNNPVHPTNNFYGESEITLWNLVRGAHIYLTIDRDQLNEQWIEGEQELTWQFHLWHRETTLIPTSGNEPKEPEIPENAVEILGLRFDFDGVPVWGEWTTFLNINSLSSNAFIREMSSLQLNSFLPHPTRQLIQAPATRSRAGQVLFYNGEIDFTALVIVYAFQLSGKRDLLTGTGGGTDYTAMCRTVIEVLIANVDADGKVISYEDTNSGVFSLANDTESVFIQAESNIFDWGGLNGVNSEGANSITAGQTFSPLIRKNIGKKLLILNENQVLEVRQYLERTDGGVFHNVSTVNSSITFYVSVPRPAPAGLHEPLRRAFVNFNDSAPALNWVSSEVFFRNNPISLNPAILHGMPAHFTSTSSELPTERNLPLSKISLSDYVATSGLHITEAPLTTFNTRDVISIHWRFNNSIDVIGSNKAMLVDIRVEVFVFNKDTGVVNISTGKPSVLGNGVRCIDFFERQNFRIGTTATDNIDGQITILEQIPMVTQRDGLAFIVYLKEPRAVGNSNPVSIDDIVFRTNNLSFAQMNQERQ